MSALNVAGDLDITGPYAAAGPDICRDACPLAATEHTEDACAAEVGEHRHQFTDWFHGASGSYRFCEDPSCDGGEIR